MLRIQISSIFLLCSLEHTASTFWSKMAAWAQPSHPHSSQEESRRERAYLLCLGSFLQSHISYFWLHLSYQNSVNDHPYYLHGKLKIVTFILGSESQLHIKGSVTKKKGRMGARVQPAGSAATTSPESVPSQIPGSGRNSQKQRLKNNEDSFSGAQFYAHSECSIFVQLLHYLLG